MFIIKVNLNIKTFIVRPATCFFNSRKVYAKLKNLTFQLENLEIRK